MMKGIQTTVRKKLIIIEVKQEVSQKVRKFRE